MLRDSRAAVLIVSEALLREVRTIPDEAMRSVRHLVVVGRADQDAVSFAELVAQGSAELEAEPTSCDAPAFWLY